MAIERFRGEHFWLSNMYPLNRWIKTDLGFLVPTSEHAYMANRFVDPALHKLIVEARDVKGRKSKYALGLAAKELAHELFESGAGQVENNSVQARIANMYSVITNKFQADPRLAQLLVETGDQELIKINDHGDDFWGSDPSTGTVGLNHLGKTIMRVRSDINGEILS